MLQKVLAYVRVSSDGQVDKYGLGIQEDDIRKFCESKKYELVQVFRDEGVSGSLLERPALGELMNAVSDDKSIKGVVFVRLDRLARDLLVQEQILGDFKKQDLEPICIEDPDLSSTDPSRKLFRQIKGSIAEYDKNMIGLRLSAGRRKKVQTGGGYAGGKVPFGFEIKDGNYSPHPEQLKIVKEIFQLRRKPKLKKQLSYQKIASRLTNKHAPQGYEFNPMTLHYIINNKIYKGIQTYSGIEKYHPELDIL